MIKLNDKERGICMMAVLKMQHFWRYVSPETWVNVPNEEIEALIDKLLGISNSDELLLGCPLCDYAQIVKVSDYRANIAYGGLPYTCPDHNDIALKPVDLVAFLE